MALNLIVNGQPKELPGLSASSTLADLVAELGLKGDRVAIEHNGEIAGRTTWDDVRLNPGDRLEVVHFVGGGSAPQLIQRL